MTIIYSFSFLVIHLAFVKQLAMFSQLTQGILALHEHLKCVVIRTMVPLLYCRLWLS